MPKYFPWNYDIGPHCQLALWLVTYDSYLVDQSVSDTNPRENSWILNRIYSNPLWAGVNESLLRMILERLPQAAKFPTDGIMQDPLAPPKPKLITAAKKAGVEDAINRFKNNTTITAQHAQTLHSLLRTSRNSLEPETLELLTDLDNHSFYFPTNYAPPSALAERQDLLLAPAPTTNDIWDTNIAIDDTLTTTRKLGVLTFEELFRYRLKNIYRGSTEVFSKFTTAKTSGILRRSLETPLKGDPTTDEARYEEMQSGNRKCCSFGECVTSQYPADYCEQDPAGFCNSMSDPCHT